MPERQGTRLAPADRHKPVTLRRGQLAVLGERAQGTNASAWSCAGGQLLFDRERRPARFEALAARARAVAPVHKLRKRAAARQLPYGGRLDDVVRRVLSGGRRWCAAVGRSGSALVVAGAATAALAAERPIADGINLHLAGPRQGNNPQRSPLSGTDGQVVDLR